MLSRLTSAAMGTALTAVRDRYQHDPRLVVGKGGRPRRRPAGSRAEKPRLGGAEYPELQWTVLEDEDGGERKCKQGDFGAEQRDRLAAMLRRYVQSR